ncbi:MAG: HAD hydrolase-like protein [Gammaproteobacteria bacterium]|nr:HAD hydrolase-like protein [Gammaproteobacteria bacterium]
MIETIILDYGGVITPMRRSGAFIEWLLDTYDVDTEALRSLFCGPEYRDYQRGIVSEQAFYNAVQALGVEADTQELADRLVRFNEPVPGMQRLVDALQAKFDLCLISDSTPELTRDVKRRFKGVFRVVCFSDEYGYVKSDKVLFDILLTAIDRTTNTCLYIDDRPENLEYPESKGVQCIRFVGVDALVRDLDTRWGIRVCI